jgi:hypothetical protein
MERPMMQFNTDPEWMRKRAAQEDGCFVSVGGMITDLEQKEKAMNDSKRPSMITLDPPERSRTYIFKSGHRHTLENVVAVGIEKWGDRVQTADGKLHVVLTVIGRSESPVDWVIAKELDCDAWTF